MDLAKYLWIIGSVLIGILGTIHLLYTFFTDKFWPRDIALVDAMRKASPVLSKDLKMWTAWIGFNGSHSSGVMFIAIMNAFLAFRDFMWLSGSNFYFLFNICTMAFYVFLARKYWFTPPLVGATITLVCYVVSYVLTIGGRG